MSTSPTSSLHATKEVNINRYNEPDDNDPMRITCLQRPWVIMSGESGWCANGDEGEDGPTRGVECQISIADKIKALKLAQKDGTIPETIPCLFKHSTWITKAALTYYDTQFSSGGVWLWFRNIRCWDYGVYLTIGILRHRIGFKKTADLLERTYEQVWLRELTPQERHDFLHAEPAINDINVKMDKYVIELSKLTWGSKDENGIPKPAEESVELAANMLYLW